MNWSTELAYLVTPKSGPMRAMRTLGDVNHALLDDLPARTRHRRHWFIVGRLLLAAAKGSSRLELLLATDALVVALEVEDWMTSRTRINQTDSQKVVALARPARADQLQVPMALAA